MNMMMRMPMMGMPPAQPMPSKDQLAEAKRISEASTWEAVSGILRSNERRNYVIDVETDATAFEDEEAEKRARIEFMGAVTNWLQIALPAVQQNPALAPLMKELTMFSVGAFKIGRPLEESFEDAFEQAKDMEPPENPESAKLQAEMAMKDKEMQISMAESHSQAQLAQQRQAQELQFKQQEHAMKAREMDMTLQFKQRELEMKEREMQQRQAAEAFSMNLQRHSAEFDMETRREEAQERREAMQMDRYLADDERQYQRGMADRETQFREREFDMKSSDMAHRQRVDADNLRGPTGKTQRDEIAAQIQQLTIELEQGLSTLRSQIMQIAEGQQQSSGAVAAIASHLTAPFKIKRDEQRRMIGVERGESDGADLPTLIERLKQGRQMLRGSDNLIEQY